MRWSAWQPLTLPDEVDPCYLEPFCVRAEHFELARTTLETYLWEHGLVAAAPDLPRLLESLGWRVAHLARRPAGDGLKHIHGLHLESVVLALDFQIGVLDALAPYAADDSVIHVHTEDAAGHAFLVSWTVRRGRLAEAIEPEWGSNRANTGNRPYGKSRYKF